MFLDIIVKALYTLTECTSNSDSICTYYEVDINNGIFHPLQTISNTH